MWGSPLYECEVRYLAPEHGRRGPLWLSIKARDRRPAHDWRHFQAIKNEVAGPERNGIEIYPAESRLVDSSNQYHLWVLAEGDEFPPFFGFGRREVSTHEESEAELRKLGLDPSKMRQRAWQPGIATGPDYRP